MKKTLIFGLICLSLLARGQTPGAAPPAQVPQVESSWPGIVMQIPEVKRIPGNRLLVAVRLVATAKAPSSTLIGTPSVHPPNATEEERLIQLIPTPFSLEGSKMIDDRTQKAFEMLSLDPKGPTYRPSTFLGSLSPGQVLYMSLQFSTPPPPPADSTGKVPKQTVSVLLPRAQGPIQIVVPPEDTPTPAVNQ